MHDLFDILDETHVEHFVRLVEHQVGDRREVERAPADVVEDAARRADDDVDAFGKAPQLFAHRRTAVDGRDREPFFAVVGEQFFGRLECEFACRYEDDGLYRPAGGFEGLEYRQSVGRGFARAGLRLRDDVVGFCEQVGDGELLDCGGRLESLGADCGEHLLGKPQGAEIVCNGHVHVLFGTKVR